MFLIVSIIIFIFTFYLFNAYLITSNLLLLAGSVILLFSLIYIFYKYVKSTKNYIIFAIFIVLFFIYSYCFSYIDISKNYKTFFSPNIEEKQNKNIFYTYKVCMEKECINIENFNKDIEYVNYSINNIYDINGLLLLDENLIKIIEKKKELDINNIDINYSFEDYATNIINKLYYNHLSNIDFGNSIFLSKKQFDLYLKEYLFFSYNNILSNNLENIENSKYSEFSTLQYFLNRKYIYNRLFINSASMSGYGYIINNINKNMEKIK